MTEKKLKNFIFTAMSLQRNKLAGMISCLYLCGVNK